MEYMKDNTGMSDTEVRVEIERYIVWPGQALSYKVGMIKILELRENAMRELGNEFDIKDFHSAVLDHGIPPLFIVEEMVKNMISEKRPKPELELSIPDRIEEVYIPDSPDIPSE